MHQSVTRVEETQDRLEWPRPLPQNRTMALGEWRIICVINVTSTRGFPDTTIQVRGIITSTVFSHLRYVKVPQDYVKS